MKKSIIKAATVLLLAANLFSSCSKDSSDSFAGTYTFKTSGTVTLMATALVGLDDATLAAYKAAGVDVDPVTLGLYPEQGQLNVLKDDDGSFVLTFNNILGNAEITSATLQDGTLTLCGTDTKAAQVTDGIDKIGAGIVAFSGTGRMLEDVLMLQMQYQGAFSVKDVPMTVVSSDVKCVAKKNQ